MECHLYETLDYSMNQPTVYGVLQHLLHCVEVDPWVAHQCGADSLHANPNGSENLKAVSEFLVVRRRELHTAVIKLTVARHLNNMLVHALVNARTLGLPPMTSSLSRVCRNNCRENCVPC